MSVMTTAAADPWARLTRRLTARVGYGTTYSVIVYLATRVAVAIGVFTAYLLKRRLSWHQVFTHLDGWWYQWIAEHGYGHRLRLHLRGDVFHSHFSTWAFYPGYPLAIRAVHAVTDMPFALTAFLLSFAFAGLAVRAMYALGDAYGGTSVARGTAVLAATWPGSAAMNLPYSEGLFIGATAASLAALAKKRWAAAGVFGAVATSTRAMGLALLVATAVAAAHEVWTHRRPQPLLAPLLTASGAGAFYLYGWQQTGDPLVWRHAEDLWHQHLDFGIGVYYRLVNDFTRRGHQSVEALLLAVGIVVLALMAAAAVGLGRRAGVSLLAYAAVALVMVVGYSNVGPRPRMVLAFVPGFVWLARWLPPRLTDVLAVGFASMLALTAFLYVAVVTP